MAELSQPLIVPTAPQPPPKSQLRPHRGVVVLTLDILGFLVCSICGIIAWVMGNNDLREMQAGTMDPSGQGLTQAGRICGMISVILPIVVSCVILVILLLIGLFGLLAAAVSH